MEEIKKLIRGKVPLIESKIIKVAITLGYNPTSLDQLSLEDKKIIATEVETWHIF